MKKALSGIICPVLLLCLSLALTACKNDKETKSTSDQTTVTSQTVSEVTSTPKEVEIDYEKMAGNYRLKMADMEDEYTVFHISLIDGAYYIEYTGPYAYAGAEMEILGGSADSNTGDVDIDVKLYPFSGFSFLGEYWGGDYGCVIRLHPNGDVELLDGQPFLYDGSLYLEKAPDCFVHESETNTEKNQFADEILGSFRCSSIDGDERIETYFEFTKDGHFYLVEKKENYTPEIYIGRYTADWTDVGLFGDIECEMFANGGMPFEFRVRYDDEYKCPIICDSESYFGEDVFAKKEALPYKKTEPGQGMIIAPGPGARKAEIEKDWKAYTGEDSEYDEDHKATNDEIAKIEEAIVLFPIPAKYITNMSLDGLTADIICNWKFYSSEAAKFAGLTFETGKGVMPADYYTDVTIEGETDYIRTDTKALEKALKGFFKTNASLPIENGYQYMNKEDYVEMWGPGYFMENEYFWTNWSEFRTEVTEGRLKVYALKSWGDVFTTHEDHYEFLFDYNPDSPYNYSLSYLQILDSYVETGYDQQTITAYENQIRDYVNNRAKESDMVRLEAGVDGCDYARWYVYSGEYLEFAYYYDSLTGQPDNRYYFWDNALYEWIEGNGTDDKNRTRHYASDDPRDPRWKETTIRILKEAAQYR